MAKPSERELKLLRELADFLELEELTSAALATSLGFDEMTPERLEEWFTTEAFGGGTVDTSEPVARVVQVERDEQPSAAPKRLALPAARSKQGRSTTRSE